MTYAGTSDNLKTPTSLSISFKVNVTNEISNPT